MTSTRSLPTQSADVSPSKPKRLGLSWTQIAAAGFASITATVILSFFSISGTLIGAAVFSMASAVGNAVYGQSLRKTQDTVLNVLPVGKTDPASPTVVLPVTEGSDSATASAEDEVPALPAASSPASLSRRTWKRIVLFAVVIFAFVMAVVTTVELIAGRPLTDVLRGEKGTGTSIGGGGRAPAPTVTVTVTPSIVTTTPTVTRTAPPSTMTTTPTETTTASPTDTPSTTAPTSPSDSEPATSSTPSPSQSSSP